MSEKRHGDAVVRSYSDRARQYDEERNLESCWGRVAERALAEIRLRDLSGRVVDAGCGTGHALEELVRASSSEVRFVGVEPAENMRERARELLAAHDNVELVDGRFEGLPLETDSVDYLYSILAFHWTTDLEQSIRELRRVLKPDGKMDLFFTGRNTGREFTKKTTPIFLKYLGPRGLLKAAGARKHLTLQSATEAFSREFPVDRLSVEESLNTYHDDLEGHWSWWMSRVAGHFVEIAAEKRAECDQAIREAIASLAGDKGIPYTVHLLKVTLGS